MYTFLHQTIYDPATQCMRPLHPLPPPGSGTGCMGVGSSTPPEGTDIELLSASLRRLILQAHGHRTLTAMGEDVDCVGCFDFLGKIHPDRGICTGMGGMCDGWVLVCIVGTCRHC